MEEVVPCSHFSFHFFNVLFVGECSVQSDSKVHGKTTVFEVNTIDRDSFLPTSRLSKWNKLTRVFAGLAFS